MREITHLVLLGRVSGGTAKKGDTELTEQELRRASGGIRGWPSRYRRGLLPRTAKIDVVWHTAMHSRRRGWARLGSRVTQSRLPLFPQQQTFKESGCDVRKV